MEGRLRPRGEFIRVELIFRQGVLDERQPGQTDEGRQLASARRVVGNPRSRSAVGRIMVPRDKLTVTKLQFPIVSSRPRAQSVHALTDSTAFALISA